MESLDSRGTSGGKGIQLLRMESELCLSLLLSPSLSLSLSLASLAG